MAVWNQFFRIWPFGIERWRFLSSKFIFKVQTSFFIFGARFQFWPILSKCLQIFGHGSESIKVTSWSEYRSKILANYRYTLRKSIPHFLRFELFIKKILDWCETHGQFVGLRVRRYRETDLWPPHLHICSFDFEIFSMMLTIKKNKFGRRFICIRQWYKILNF